MTREEVVAGSMLNNGGEEVFTGSVLNNGGRVSESWPNARQGGSDSCPNA